MPTTTRNSQNSFSQFRETVPSLIPSTPETLVSTDVYIDVITLQADATGAIVTIKDRQGTPVLVFGPITCDPGSPIIAKMEHRFCPGGLTWESSVNNVIVGYVRWAL